MSELGSVDRARRELERLSAAGLRRRLRRVSSSQGAEILLDGRQVLNFSSNDSLGLAAHPSLRAASKDAIDRFGVGSGSSRLIVGNMEPHEQLERGLADFLGRERALLFPSGFQANAGCIPVLADADTVILSDELNHASLIDGMRLSRAQRVVFPHNDVAALRRLLLELPRSTPALVVTESLFSMAGDRARLAEVAALKRERPFLLWVDEAHAMGALGPGGRGLAAELGCLEDVDLLLGTLGKAFGVSGAFVAAKAPFIDLLVNRARSFIYTTGPMPAAAAAAAAALQLVRQGDTPRARLAHNTRYFRDLLAEFLSPPAGCDHVVPVPCPGPVRVMRACELLLERGIYCQGLRPPTVPRGSCCLRFSLTALHTDSQLERAARAMREIPSQL